MDVESLAKELILKNMTPEQQMAVLDSVKASVSQAKEVQKRKIGENVDLVVQALKKIESDIRSRFDDVGNAIDKRVSTIKDGRDGSNGKDGRDGKDGKNGRDGAKGDQGERGQDGTNGVDGNDGVSVTNAHIDFDGSLVITLSSGIEINVGEVVAPDLAESIKVITNGGGTSQSVIDTLASLQTQITNLIPSQTGNSGKFLTTNGTSTSWASVAGGLSYQGTWNATTNTPTLTSSVGVNGYYYITDVAGSTNLNGITDWQIGDWLLFNGSVWQKIDQSNLVTSVAGRTGAITLANTDISGLGTMSTQNASSVAITGGTESAVSHSGDTIADYLNYTPSTAPSYQQGRTWYDSTAKALAFYNDVSGVAVHVGHDLQFKVINNTGSTIANGSPVYITGTSSGQTYPNIALAKADVASTSTVIGLADGAITNGSAGYVTSIGNIDNVNTSTFTVGQVLYLSPYSAGQLMNTIPPTGITVQVGMVTFIDSSTGKIYVKQTTPLNVPASIISGAVAIVNGGTGQTTQQAAINTLTGAVTSGYYPRGNGTNVIMSAIQAADVPTLNQNTTGTASNVTGTVAIANGGTGQTTANTAFNALAPSQTSNSGKYLTTNGTDTSWATISSTGTVTSVAATVPSFLSVTGSPITTSGTLAIAYSGTALPVANGGTGATSAAAARTSLGLVIGTDVLAPNGSAASLTSFPTLNQNTTGNAATATSATSLNSSNFISQKGSQGSWNADFQATPAGTTAYNGDLGANGTNGPGGSWWIQQNFRHTNSSNFWGTQVAWGWEDNANKLATRNVSGGGYGAWVYYLNSSNYTSYVAQLSTASGSAPSYSARAWVNFNGTGTVAIRSSGNVSSITDNGIGDYTINFTTAMPDANYSNVISMSYVVSYIPYCNVTGSAAESAPTASSFRMAIINTGGTNVADAKYVSVAIFR